MREHFLILVFLLHLCWFFIIVLMFMCFHLRPSFKPNINLSIKKIRQVGFYFSRIYQKFLSKTYGIHLKLWNSARTFYFWDEIFFLKFDQNKHIIGLILWMILFQFLFRPLIKLVFGQIGDYRCILLNSLDGESYRQRKKKQAKKRLYSIARTFCQVFCTKTFFVCFELSA